MSRLGNKAVVIPKGVEVKFDKHNITVKGPKGTLIQDYKSDVIDIAVEGQELTISLLEGKEDENAAQGLYRALVHNMVEGVFKPFQKQLELIGIGYRAAVKGQTLEMQLGYSHPVEINIPKELTVAVEKNTLITISGPDKRQVGQFAAFVREKRKPEPYKGKGIRYVGEVVRKKAGKTGKSGK